MSRISAHSPIRPLAVIALCLLASCVTAAGVAWACLPSGSLGVSPRTGLAGTTVTLTGAGFVEGADVEIRRDSDIGPLVKVVKGASFSTQVTIPDDAGPGVHLLVAVGKTASGDHAGSNASAAFEVTRRSTIALQPGSGRSGSTATAVGRSFPGRTVEIRWGSAAGPLLGTPIGPAFSSPVTIPSDARGSHRIVAFARDVANEPAALAETAFQLTGPAMPAPFVPLDTVGPAIAGAQLTRANRVRTVSRKGEVQLFCGRFTEPGVAGRCGARSTRRIAVRGTTRGGTRRSAVLRLRSKSFEAEPGRPLTLSFRLTRSSLRMLKAAKKVRMRGTVDARDARGNRTTRTFHFTLKAPKRSG